MASSNNNPKRPESSLNPTAKPFVPMKKFAFDPTATPFIPGKKGKKHILQSELIAQRDSFLKPRERVPQEDLDPSLRNNFCKLPPELRLKVYSHLLTVPNWINITHRPQLVPTFRGGSIYNTTNGAFLTSKLISEEARQVFYSSNAFYIGLQIHLPQSQQILVSVYQSLIHNYTLIKRFINSIGSLNASRIRRVRIDWPEIGGLHNQPMFAYAADRELLELMKAKCTSLKTIEFSPYGLHFVLLKLWDYQSNEMCDRYWGYLDSQLRAVPSVRRICLPQITRYPPFPGNLNDEIDWYEWLAELRDKLVALGWKFI